METPEGRLVEILQAHGIDFVATLPCEKVKGFLSLVPQHFHELPLTREADGIGICAGLLLAGRHPAMVVQNTGLGNSITDIASLLQVYRLPLTLLISWRGVYKEAIEVQRNLGTKTPRLLEALGVPYTIVETKEDLKKVAVAIEDGRRGRTPHAVLFSPQVWEGSPLSSLSVETQASSPGQGRALPPKGRADQQVPSFQRQPRRADLTRYEAIRAIMDHVDGQAVVSNIGIPSKELFAVRDRPLNFYMLGSLGLATSIGIGLSLGQEREVWVLDGDGSLLMNPNALISLGLYGRGDLTVFAIDNASYGSTGDQATPTLDRIDLELLAQACGVGNTHKVHDASELRAALAAPSEGPRFVHFLARPGNAAVPNVPLSPGAIAERFMVALHDKRE
ncbi:MAG: sulfopyruvate decarboxylase subunit alpha [Chloroflexi bacterium]|nr:sulfopyruvate decarboxylase subunit alpha [Chloroflexota bacterium]